MAGDGYSMKMVPNNFVLRHASSLPKLVGGRGISYMQGRRSELGGRLPLHDTERRASFPLSYK